MSKQTIISTPPGIHDVVVISAGSVRLETTFGLRQRSIENIFVTCRTCTSSTDGASNRPFLNGLKAVKALKLAAYEAVKKVGMRDANSLKAIV